MHKNISDSEDGLTILEKEHPEISKGIDAIGFFRKGDSIEVASTSGEKSREELEIVGFAKNKIIFAKNREGQIIQLSDLNMILSISSFK